MAGFGFFKPKAVSVQPGDVPSLRSLSLQDKLMMFGALAQGDTASAMQIPMMAAARARQAQNDADDRELSRYVSGEGLPTLTRKDRPALSTPPEPEPDAMGSITSSLTKRLGGDVASLPKLDSINVDIPQFGVTTTGGREGPVSVRGALPMLMRMYRNGRDIKPLVEVLDKSGPDYEYVNNVRVDKRDPNGPREITALDKGQEHVYNARGEIVGVRNADGSIDAASKMAGAVQEAQERAKAGYDLVEVPQADGSTVKLPRLKAVELLGGGPGPAAPTTGLPTLGGSPGSTAAAPAFGRSQTPAEAELAKGRAGNQVKQEGIAGEAVAQARLDLPKIEDQAKFTLGILNQIRKHPSLGDRTGNSTLLPALRPRDVDFDVLVKQIGGGAFLEAINTLRGTGQISEIEGKKATDAIARMQNQRQSEPGFVKAMDDYESVVKMGISRARNRAAGAATVPRITAEQARAELARRRAAGQ